MRQKGHLSEGPATQPMTLPERRRSKLSFNFRIFVIHDGLNGGLIVRVRVAPRRTIVDD